MARGASPEHSRTGLDFGPGFYLTSNRGQAEGWAKVQSKARGAGPACLVQFIVDYASLARLSQVSFVRCAEGTAEFWIFVRAMRTGAFDRHFDEGCFDMVCGPVVKDRRMLRVLPDSDQFSFHGSGGYGFINSRRKHLVAIGSDGNIGP